MARCPICLRSFTKKAEILTHVDKLHHDELPEDMSTAQYVYMLNHNGRKSGICRYCGKETPWNEKTGKPYQICGSPDCKAKNKEIAEQRMLKVYGKTNLLSDPKQQEKMLANRSISGTYVWSDGKHKFTYTGSYEKFAIEWLDKVMDIDPETIQMPGPILPYDLDGETKYWITDIYLTEFNLIIEVKDGHENNHPGFAGNRAREAAKDKLMMNQREFNYMKLTHKNMMQLVQVLTEIRLNNILSEEKNKVAKPSIRPIIVINESAKDVKIKDTINRLLEAKQRPDMPSMYYENIDRQLEKLQALQETASDGIKPRGKTRWVFENNIKKIRLLPNEQSGHFRELEYIKEQLSFNPYHVWLSSDIHIGREDINMNDDQVMNAFINDVNKKVPKNDILILCGDIVTREDMNFVRTRTKEMLDKINTKKVVLILGNNDHLTVKEYYDCGYYYVTDAIDHDDYLITHVPDHVAMRYNIHGHIHGDSTIYNTSAENHIDVYYHRSNEGASEIFNVGNYVTMYKAGAYKYMKTVMHT